MTFRLNVIRGSLVAAGVSLVVPAIAGASYTNVGTSLLTGSTAVAYSGGTAGMPTTATVDGGLAFGGGGPATLDMLAANDDQDGAFLFSSTVNQELQYSNVSAPNGFSDVRFFTAPADPQRLPTALSVYSSTSATTSIDPADYTLDGTFTLAQGTETPYGNNAGRAYYEFTLPTPAAAGTQSVLAVFTAGGNSTRVYEFQAFTPEPASLGLLGIGAVGLLVRRRRCLS